jgi:hypothetical protein
MISAIGQNIALCEGSSPIPSYCKSHEVDPVLPLPRYRLFPDV